MKQTDTILDSIMKSTVIEIQSKMQRKSIAELEKELILSNNSQASKSGFRNKLREIRNHTKSLVLIAEIKKASPSAGIVNKNFDLSKIIEAYQSSAHVSAISVVTEKKYFHGSTEFIAEVKKNTEKPVLRKDFIIDEYQIYESAVLKADAILLIAKCLTLVELKKFIKLASDLKLDVLVEVHDKDELQTAIIADAPAIGVNSRNLKDFSINLKLFEELIPQIPEQVIRVAESGIRNSSNVQMVYDLGADAVLVGTQLMGANNITQEINNLFKY